MEREKGLNICQYSNSNFYNFVKLQLFKTKFSLNGNIEWETQRSMFEWINKISKLIRDKRSDLNHWFKGTVLGIISSDPLHVQWHNWFTTVTCESLFVHWWLIYTYLFNWELTEEINKYNSS